MKLQNRARNRVRTEHKQGKNIAEKEQEQSKKIAPFLPCSCSVIAKNRARTEQKQKICEADLRPHAIFAMVEIDICVLSLHFYL